MSTTPRRDRPAPARSVPSRQASAAAPTGGAAAAGGAGASAGCFRRTCPNGKLPDGPTGPTKQTGVGCCVLIYAVFCFLASFTRGWYSVRYSPDISVETCSLPLWECSLSACKPRDSHTGYHGEGDCGTLRWAQAFFLLAAAYAICYLLFISGILDSRDGGQVKNWTGGNFANCCTYSSECNHHLPAPVPPKLCAHGVMMCGVPCLMLLGLIAVASQDRSEFDGMPEQGYGGLFWLSLIMALIALAIALFNAKAEAILQEGAKRALPPRPMPARTNSRAGGAGGARTMPPSAPNGFNYYNPPSTNPTTVQTVPQLAAARITATTQINRIGVDKGWVALPADFRGLMGGRP